MRVESVKTLRDGALVGRSITLTRERAGRDIELFALVPEAFASELSERDDVFVPALVMLALVNREDLDLGGMAADPALVRNCISAALQHQDWVARFRVPTVTNWTASPAPLAASENTASFFSGGIDSLFTLTRHSSKFRDDPTRLRQQDVRLALHVFHTEQPSQLQRNPVAERVLGKGAASLGARLVPVFSNIMSFDEEWTQNYARVTHGAGLAAIARLVSAKLSACLIASSHTYGQLHPWGSSPIVDPLFSGRDMAVLHDGSVFTRFEKTEYITKSAEALSAINVCDRLIEQRGYVNCSKCQKCLRTMTALDLCGVTGDAAPAFDWTDYTPESFGQIYFKNWSERSFAEELASAAEQRGRLNVSRAIRSAVRRSGALSPLASFEDQVRHLPSVRKGKRLLLKLRAGAYHAVGLRR